ncbi:MAG: SAM-dependent chlorinase/fluorinase [Myxococcales bacterium]|nr:SAM-dependent chlorinase/fluorinase [Myxococcales bacterium]
MPDSTRPIGLLTDFGTRSPYVAAMKGVIAGIAPEASIHDLSHAIEPGNIREAALALEAIVPYWPPRAIHVCVIDPGVGSARRGVVVESRVGVFVGPDNGLFSTVYAADPDARVHALVERRYFRDVISSTFHGRDVFSPVAAHVALGVDPSEFGPAVDDPQRIAFSAPRREGDRIVGEVALVDHYGNLISNVPAEMLGGSRDWSVTVGGERVQRIGDHYAEVEVGDLISHVGSTGRVELSENMGNAARRLGVGVGARFVLERVG